MNNKIFVDSGIKEQSAYFGWQNKDNCLYGLKEGYKKSADELVNIALQHGSQGDIKVLDTYIFPIIFLYRHCIEISIKHIYMRCFGEIPKGGHDLVILWDKIENNIINKILTSEDFIEQVKQYKKHFIEWNFNGINFAELRKLINELQGFDNKADVWRYLLSKEGELYFTDSQFVDYTIIQERIDNLYEILDYIYFVTDQYLSS